MRIQLSALVGIHSFHHMIHHACERRHKLTSVLAESTSCAVAFPSEAKSGHAIPGTPDPAVGLSEGTGIARLPYPISKHLLILRRLLGLGNPLDEGVQKGLYFCYCAQGARVRREQGDGESYAEIPVSLHIVLGESTSGPGKPFTGRHTCTLLCFAVRRRRYGRRRRRGRGGERSCCCWVKCGVSAVVGCSVRCLRSRFSREVTKRFLKVGEKFR